MSAMYCTGCEHMDGRAEECKLLVPMVLCGTCGACYHCSRLRCGRCRSSVPSFKEAGELVEDEDGQFIRPSHCPLTREERELLNERQRLPKQRELF